MDRLGGCVATKPVYTQAEIQRIAASPHHYTKAGIRQIEAWEAQRRSQPQVIVVQQQPAPSLMPTPVPMPVATPYPPQPEQQHYIINSDGSLSWIY